MSLTYDVKEIRDLLDDALSKLKEIESDADDLEDRVNDGPFPINTVYDQMKLNFVQEIWNKYSLEDLQKIFNWEPGKGIQLKLKK